MASQKMPQAVQDAMLELGVVPLSGDLDSDSDADFAAAVGLSLDRLGLVMQFALSPACEDIVTEVRAKTIDRKAFWHGVFERYQAAQSLPLPS